jgi:predicted enzyme related to lactoylglutathione lyase
MPANPVRHITVDTHDPVTIAEFWAQLTGYRLDPDSDAEGALLHAGVDGAPGILFIPVPDEKAGKNRVHLDIQPPTGTRDEFVERMLALGASTYEDHRRPDGTGWVTMRDPEGNEFCVERSAAERGAPTD